MRKSAYVNGDIYTGDRVYADHAILIDGKTIAGIVPSSEIPSDYEAVDVGGLNIAPGFIDLQVNGGNDVLFNDNPIKSTIERIRDGHRKFGTTSILPTFITDKIDKMKQAREAVEECLTESTQGILGIHFEGPLISADKAGVHDPSLIIDFVSHELDELLHVPVDGRVLFTLAPEQVELGYINKLRERGVLIACGHSSANKEQVHKAIDAGISLGTHVFNAMTTLSSRDPGVTGTLLADDRVTCSFICDGFHVDFDVLKIAFASKPRGKAILVTDAMPPVGGTKQTFPLGPYKISIAENGRCSTSDGVLAGSGLDMATAVRNAMQKVGIPKDEALRMASTYPAIYLGISDTIGYLKPGYKADLVLFDNEIYVQAVVCSGEQIKVAR